MELIRSENGKEIIVHPGWDRDGELFIECQGIYLNRAAIARLRNALSIELGDIND